MTNPPSRPGPSRPAVVSPPPRAGGAPSKPLPPRRRRGVSVVEFALVAPAFFCFLLGIIEVGRGLMVSHQLANAARMACREGVLEGKDTAAIKAVVEANLQGQGITSAVTTVTVNDAAADAGTARSKDEITVRVTLPVNQFTWLPGGSYLKGSLGGAHALRRE